MMLISPSCLDRVRSRVRPSSIPRRAARSTTDAIRARASATMRRVIASSRVGSRSTLDAIASSSSPSSRARSSSTGPDGASRRARPRARVDVDALPRPPPSATTDAERDEDDEMDEMDAETAAREHAERRRAFHAARGMDALEHGGPSGPLEPTRYGDWERQGRASDF